MTITFSQPAAEPTPSLAYQLGLTGNIRWKTFESGIRLTFEDNEPERFEVWVAEKPRTAVIEVTEPDYEPDTRFRMVYA